MPEREILIKLLRQADEDALNKIITDYEEVIVANADYLLANGVIVPPCKVGDTVYEVISPKTREGYIISSVVCAVHIADGGSRGGSHKRDSYILVECPNTKYTFKYTFNKIGKTVFLTPEEAEEAALKAR